MQWKWLPSWDALQRLAPKTPSGSICHSKWKARWNSNFEVATGGSTYSSAPYAPEWLSQSPVMAMGRWTGQPGLQDGHVQKADAQSGRDVGARDISKKPTSAEHSSALPAQSIAQCCHGHTLWMAAMARRSWSLPHLGGCSASWSITKAMCHVVDEAAADIASSAGDSLPIIVCVGRVRRA